MRSCLRYAGYFLSAFAFFFLAQSVQAKESAAYSTLEETVGSLSFITIFISTFLLLSFAGISIFIKPLTSSAKKLLFICISVVTIAETLFLGGSTVYVNLISHSKGPVHYHADFELYNCGDKVNLLDPTGLSNKIGTSTLHEHNDDRIHLEGVVVVEDDQSLGKFFHVIGGYINTESISYPTDSGQVVLNNGDTCPDGAPGTLNVFVYKSINGKHVQQKVTDPAVYIYAPYSQVPNGDCVIIEFGPASESTEKICRSYQVAEKLGKIKNGGRLNN